VITSDLDAFLERAAARLRQAPEGTPSLAHGDHYIDRQSLPRMPDQPMRPAAVLVPIVTHGDEATVLLTERATGLRTHSGQIAFPGGRIDPGEAPLDTALREGEEEIGLDPGAVRPLGYLDGYHSSTGYVVTPVVGLVSPPLALSLNPHEVTDVFEVPLGFLMDPANHEVHARDWKGGIRQYYAMPFRERYIWGVTAAILRNLYVRLHG
jgi:8-oxo-dGTP pyrophosphatase MutT (NUDIX family)